MKKGVRDTKKEESVSGNLEDIASYDMMARTTARRFCTKKTKADS